MYTQTGMPGGMGMALPGMMQPPMMMPQMLQEGGEVGPPADPPALYQGGWRYQPTTELGMNLGEDARMAVETRIPAIEAAMRNATYPSPEARRTALENFYARTAQDPASVAYKMERQLRPDVRDMLVNKFKAFTPDGQPIRTTFSLEEQEELLSAPSIAAEFGGPAELVKYRTMPEQMEPLMIRYGIDRVSGMGAGQQGVSGAALGAGSTMYTLPRAVYQNQVVPLTPEELQAINLVNIEASNLLRNQVPAEQQREHISESLILGQPAVERKAGGEIPMPYMMASRPKQRMAQQQQQQPEMELAIAVMAPQQQEMPSVDALLDELDDKEVQALYAALETRIANRNKK